MLFNHTTIHVARRRSPRSPAFEGKRGGVGGGIFYSAKFNATARPIRYAFGKKVAEANEVMKSAKDDCLITSWTMRMGGKTVVSMPKINVLRAFIFSHLIHHRAQLGVYLRMKEVALPSVYGPTADCPM